MSIELTICSEPAAKKASKVVISEEEAAELRVQQTIKVLECQATSAFPAFFVEEKVLTR